VRAPPSRRSCSPGLGTRSIAVSRIASSLVWFGARPSPISRPPARVILLSPLVANNGNDNGAASARCRLSSPAVMLLLKQMFDQLWRDALGCSPVMCRTDLTNHSLSYIVNRHVSAHSNAGKRLHGSDLGLSACRKPLGTRRNSKVFGSTIFAIRSRALVHRVASPCHDRCVVGYLNKFPCLLKLIRTSSIAEQTGRRQSLDRAARHGFCKRH
jgi:hypothetical protein